MAGLAESLSRIPPITRFFTIASVLISLAAPLNIVDPREMYLDWGDVSYGFWQGVFLLQHQLPKAAALFWVAKLPQLRRFVLPYFNLGTEGVLLILQIYLFYNFSNHLEGRTGKFRGNFPDYLWFILFCLVAIGLMSAVLTPVVVSHHSSLLAAITYYWLRNTKNLMIKFMGVIPIKLYYLPLFDLGVSIISGGLLKFVLGVAAAYLYQCLASGTLPVYNLVPGIYGSRDPLYRQGHRVGNVNVHEVDDLIPDSIFDLGYLPAPAWLYSLTKIRTRLRRQTAFTRAMEGVTVARTHEEPVAFSGRGHRLGT